MGEARRAGRHAQEGAELLARAVADGDADIAIAAIRRRRIAGEIEAQLPERLGAHEICAARQFFHVTPSQGYSPRRHREQGKRENLNRQGAKTPRN